MWMQVLGAHLLHELYKSQAEAAGDGDGGSPWHVYLDQLPRSYTTFCNWTPGDIEELQDAAAVAVAEDAVEEARAQWAGVLPTLKELGEGLRLADCESV